jgi:hypothetical protein
MRKSDFYNNIWVHFTETVLKFVRHWNLLKSFEVNGIKHKQQLKLILCALIYIIMNFSMGDNICPKF